MNYSATSRSESVPFDTIFTLASDSRRRALICILARHDRELTLNDLTKEVVMHEADSEITDVPGETVVRVANSLYHNHLPRLAAAEAVRFNHARKLVEPTERLESVASYLKSTSERGG